MGYIYKIVNDINDKVYIGQTQRSIQERWNEHLKESKNTRSHTHLYNAMRKYGIDQFHIEIIEEVTNNILNEREIYWISQYNSFYNGYNSSLGGEGNKIIDNQLVLKLWNEGKLISEIAHELKRDRGTISLILRNQLNISDSEISSRAHAKSSSYANHSFNHVNNGCCIKHSVYQLDKDTEEILNQFNSLTDAANYIDKNNYVPIRNGISKVCRKERLTAYGYKWKYAEDMECV